MSEESIFSKEEKILEQAESIVNGSHLTNNPLLQPYHDLLTEYRKLYRQTRRLVKMGDRTQKDLNELNTELQKHKEILSRMSYADGLTGIANRRKFNETIETEWKKAARNKTLLALVILDLDFFKPYNDNYGHSAGDDCLVQIAGALSEAVKRPGDLAARIGGEEFAVLLPETDSSGAVNVARRIQDNIEALGIVHEFSLVSTVVTASMGVAAMVPDTELSYNELVETADQQLYAAKEEGRNRVKGG
ncbi:MAG: diguanylate cyclase [Desulfopila sp.]